MPLGSKNSSEVSLKRLAMCFMHGIAALQTTEFYLITALQHPASRRSKKEKKLN